MLEIRADGSGTVEVTVRGELDMHQAPGLRSAVIALLNRGDVTAVNLDLAAVTFLDATGAGAVIVAHRIAINLRVRLRLCSVSPAAARILTLVGAADILPTGPPVSRGRTGHGGRAPRRGPCHRRRSAHECGQESRYSEMVVPARGAGQRNWS